MPADLFSADTTPRSATRDVWTVSRLNQDVKQLLDSSFGLLWLQGEISNFSRPASGHCYFSMKDSRAQIRCAMFKSRNRYLDFTPENGMQILARGRLGLFEARGEYQFIVEHIEEVGSGALQRQYEQRFARFKKEGLFDEEKKRPVATMPETIGVISSASGAALHDVLDVLSRRYPVAAVRVYPCPVQGAGAAQKIATQIARAASGAHCDTLLLVRGGGSAEDLWAFNEEVVVRAIANCTIPLISGIGHETDFTLADFAADIRAPTPSAAAELACPERGEISARFNHWQRHLQQKLNEQLTQRQQQLTALARRLTVQHPERQLQQRQQRCDELTQRLARAVVQRHVEQRNTVHELSLRLAAQSPRHMLARQQTALAHVRTQLYSVLRQRLTGLHAKLQENMHALHIASPMATLERGYSITWPANDANCLPLTTAKKTAVGDTLATRLANGIIYSTVSATKNDVNKQ